MARVTANLLFATHDGVDLFGDLYLPAADGLAPILIAAPGGGWLRGDRSQLRHWGERLAAEGFGVFVVDYRRSTDGRIFPQNAQDVFAAVRFIHGEARALGVDAERIGMLGASAGAHLAALTTLAAGTDLFAKSYPDDPHAAARPAIRALVGVYGIYDLPVHWRTCQEQDASSRDDMVDRMLGATLTENPAAYSVASPITYMSQAPAGLKTAIIWGDSDVTVAPRQSEDFASALGQAGIPVTAHRVRGAEHFWFSKHADTRTGFNAEIAPELINFLNDALCERPT